MLSCLIGAVGLTRSENPCIIQGLTTEQIARLRQSDSSLYLDEVEGGLSWQAIKAIDTAKSYYQQVTQAQDNAIKEIDMDLITELALFYQQGKKRFAGTIGQKVMTASLQNMQPWQGIRFTPNDDSDATLSIRRITAAFNAAGFVDYKLIRVPAGGITGEVVHTWAGNEIIANVWKEATAFSTVLNLFTEENYVYDYYLVYNRLQITNTALPKNNEISCNCSGQAALLPGQYAQVQGVSFDILQVNGMVDVSNGATVTLSNIQADSFAHGLLVEIEINCNESNLFCKEYQNKRPVKETLNYMLLYKMQYLLMKALINTPNLSIYSSMEKELMLTNMGIFKNKYEKRIPYIIQQVDVNEAGGCFTCKQRANQPVKRTIFI